MPNENTVIVKEIRDRADAELVSLIESKSEELQQAKFKHALGQLQTTHELKQLKRDIARLNTVLRESVAKKTIEAEQASSAS